MTGMQRSGSTGIRSTRLFLKVFSLTFLIPVLVIAYFLFSNPEGKIEGSRSYLIPLLITATIALLGLYLIHKILRAVVYVLETLPSSTGEEVSKGNTHGQEEVNATIEALTQLNIQFRENAQKLDASVRQLAVLTEVTELTARIPDLLELLSLVLRKAMATTQSRKGTILLRREEGDELEVVAAEGWTPNLAGPIEMTDTLAGRVIESGRPLLSEDMDSTKSLSRNNNSELYSSPSFLIMPLNTSIGTIGALCLSEKNGGARFDKQDQQFLTVLLGQIGFAVENARLLKQARDSARTLEDTVYAQGSQLQNARKMILQADRLSVLGQLVAGVAHEINNPLTSVLGYTELLLDQEVEQNDNVQLRTVFEESNRAARIIRNLLAFAHDSRPGRSPVLLNDLVLNVVNLRGYDLRMRNIDISTDLAPGIPRVLLDPARIQQVLLNLINNSAEAMISHETRKIRIGTSHSNGEISLWIADTGRGIPDSLKDRIFEPFFSTHSGHTHTGLGLSISKGVIEEHGGGIELVSVEGQGTRMTIHLPLILAPDEEPQTTLPPQPMVERFENLFALSIDDERDNAELVARILERMGFRVEVMTNSPQALRRLSQENFDLVVCDIRMPDLDGRQLYRELKKLRPRTFPRTLFTTGDSADPEALLFAENNHVRLVAKPFTSEELTRAVQEMFAVITAPVA
jgi:signal transduction histidine kinase/CheY-like chemotaxis protein